jgi:hypothetical protein
MAINNSLQQLLERMQSSRLSLANNLAGKVGDGVEDAAQALPSRRGLKQVGMPLAIALAAFTVFRRRRER